MSRIVKLLSEPTFLQVFLGFFFVHFAFWIIYWPGIYSPDVFFSFQCLEMNSGLPCHLIENSLLWAGINFLSVNWNPSYSIYLFCQVALSSLVFAYALKASFSRRIECLFTVLVATFLLASLLPLRMAVFVERDAFYALSWMLVVMLITGFLRSNLIFSRRVSATLILMFSTVAALLRIEGWILWSISTVAVVYFFAKPKIWGLISVMVGLTMLIGFLFLHSKLSPQSQQTYFSHFAQSYLPYLVVKEKIEITEEQRRLFEEFYGKDPVEHRFANLILPYSDRRPTRVEELNQMGLELLFKYPHKVFLQRLELLWFSWQRTSVHYDSAQLENWNGLPDWQIEHGKRHELHFRGPFREISKEIEDSLSRLFAEPIFRLGMFQPIFGLAMIFVLLLLSVARPNVLIGIAIPLVHFLFVFSMQYIAMPKHFYMEYLFPFAGVGMFAHLLGRRHSPKSSL